jgi:Fic family protein
MEALEKVKKLKAELDELRPLNQFVEQRILQKFRLDWNYHSTNLSGNGLSFSDTKALIMHGLTANGRLLKDCIEMKIHNDIVSWIFDIAGENVVISEEFIKQIHEVLLLEPYEIDSLSGDGKTIKKIVGLGKYKETTNHIFNKTKDIIYFATPKETPARMKELIERFEAKRDEAEVNPIILVAEFHHKFLRIQPFDDANGRVARLLTNLILMQYGYPPIVIKTTEKDLYLAALHQADNDNFELFLDFIARNVATSLEILIKGANGESIEEPDNLDKELSVLEQKLRKFSSKIVKREKVVILDIFDKSLQPLLERLLENYGKFDKFYIENKLSIAAGNTNKLNVNGDAGKNITQAKSLSHLRELLLNEPLELNPSIIVTYRYKTLNRDGFGDVEYQNEVKVNFAELEYRITESNSEDILSIYQKKYSEELLHDETAAILNQSAKAHQKFIEKKIDENVVVS